MKISRRSFLGWIGGAIVALATPELFKAEAAKAPRVRGIRNVYALEAVAEKDTVLVIRKIGSPTPLAAFTLRGGTCFMWTAELNGAIPLREGEPALSIEGDVTWAVKYEQDGKLYRQPMDGPPVSMRV